MARHWRKWKIRPALTREGGRIRGVFDLVMPRNMGVYERYMSIDIAMRVCERVEREKRLVRGAPF